MCSRSRLQQMASRSLDRGEDRPDDRARLFSGNPCRTGERYRDLESQRFDSIGACELARSRQSAVEWIRRTASSGPRYDIDQMAHC